MINENNFKALLKHLSFEENNHVFSKFLTKSSSYLNVDFEKKALNYPESDGLTINERQTCNFKSSENMVVFECVCKLLEKGYKPEHIELEPKWKLGHGASGGRADILVKNQQKKPLLIIECKTFGKEFNKAWKDTLDDGGQLFSYAQQIAETAFLCLYASEFDSKENQLLIEQRIISHKDNETIIAFGEQVKSYKEASNVKNRFEVWKETYQLEYSETGIFEEDIQPYQIGKNKYTLDSDTRPVTEKDKEGKYHRFRTILRQHNIARKETAFEVLVNLFLAKIVDEEENKNNLEFYWKGVAYDTHYDFIDRLQKLYQLGMRKFLKDEVMYISNEQIDGAFWTVKNKHNATKKQIQKYFRDLKFFSNNAFSLINVHNERLFNRNTKVLIELVQMWQGLRLKTKEQNQFLGDMFEYFLDNSIKQSEGQFFTPMPITKFIVASLPLENKIQQASEPLAVIDFACGAGHFLTEYAHQIKPLVEKHKQTDLSDYYEQIIGIEKEDRLAKIAKVSAYMYGQDQIKIIEKDALSDIADIKPASFDVLVANPPFAVEGFLLNLNERQKENYELIETTEINSNTNTIQCFFIERAKQLMAGGGVVGIIVPSSILSNSDKTHIATREIILKYFDLIALVELGSGTFGKTGTNTVVLFLKRKDKRPEPAEHYQNRVDDYFDSNLSEQLEGKARLNNDISEYQDIGLIKAYCQHTELPFDEYIKLFAITTETINTLDELFKIELFTEYKQDFHTSTDIKNLKKKKFFKDKSKQEQALELNKRLIAYLQKIEKDKVYYFMLAFKNPQKVLIIKSPSNNKAQKKFLGYEWSSAKGSEGIKYQAGRTVNDIITPLFNPKNTQDKSKINHLIEQNFLGNPPDDLSEFLEYKDLISYAKVQDVLDFSRKDFNKAFSLTPKKDIVIESQWKLVKLENIMTIVRGASPRPISKFITAKKDGVNWIKIGDVNQGEKYITKAEEKITKEGALKSRSVKSDDFILSNSMSFGRPYILKIDGCVHDGWLIMTNFDKQLDKNYLFEILSYSTTQQQFSANAGGGVVENLNIDRVKSVKIPLPPKAIQQKIVTECEAIDQTTKQAQETIDKARNEIEKEVKRVSSQYIAEKLTNHIEIISGGTPKTNKSKYWNGNIPWLSVADFSNGNRFVETSEKHITEEGLENSSTRYLKKDDLIISARGTVGAMAQLKIPMTFNQSCYGLRVKEKLNSGYLFYIMQQEIKQLKDKASGVTFGAIIKSTFESIQIPIPPLPEQKSLVLKIEKLEQKIKQAQETIKKVPQQKQRILDTYLK